MINLLTQYVTFDIFFPSFCGKPNFPLAIFKIQVKKMKEEKQCL
jgi:hypothetical protein